MYTFSVSAFVKAGMVVVVVAGTGAAGAALGRTTHVLRAVLPFPCFWQVQLRDGGREDEQGGQHGDASSHVGPPAVGGAEQTPLALHALSTKGLWRGVRESFFSAADESQFVERRAFS